MASFDDLPSYSTWTTLSLIVFWTALYCVSRPGGASWVALLMSLLKMSNSGFCARNSGVTAPARAEIVWLLAVHNCAHWRSVMKRRYSAATSLYFDALAMPMTLFTPPVLACVWVGMLRILVFLKTSGPCSFSTAMYQAPSIDIAALPVLKYEYCPLASFTPLGMTPASNKLLK